MLSCPDCNPDELVPLQLAANAHGVIVGTVTLTLLLVLAVVVAGACLRYTRRLLLAGAVVLGAGIGTLTTGVLLQRLMLSHGVYPDEVTGSLARRVEWLWQGDFHAYGAVAVLFGLVIVFTESNNVMAVTRNRLVPAGTVAGWGLLNIAAGVWLTRIVELLTAGGNDVRLWSFGLVVAGGACFAFGVAFVMRVLRHPKHQKMASVPRMSKHVNRHAH